MSSDLIVSPQIFSSRVSQDGCKAISNVLPDVIVGDYSFIGVGIETEKELSQELIDKAALLFVRHFVEGELSKKFERRRQKDRSIEWDKSALSHSKEYEALSKASGVHVKLSMNYSRTKISENLEEYLGDFEEVANDALKGDCKDLRKVGNAFLRCIQSANEPHEKDAIKKAFEKADLLFHEKTGNSLLKRMIKEDPYTAARILAIKPSTVTLKGANNETLLHVACDHVREEVHVEIVQDLLKSEIDKHAVRTGFKEHNALLALAQGAYDRSIWFVNLPFNPIHSNAFEDRAFNLLVEAGLDPDVGTIGGNPLLSFCLETTCINWAWKILDKCNVEREGKLKRRPIHYAVFQGYRDFVKALIKRKVDLNVYAFENSFSSRKITPAHIAVRGGNAKMLEILIPAGANPHLQADNPFYREGCVSQWYRLEPLSAFLLAVDQEKTECVDVITKLAPPKEADLDCNIVRDLFSGPVAKVLKPGYRSLHLRVKAELVKRSAKLKAPAGISCYTNAEESLEKVQAFFERVFLARNLGSAQQICEPLVKVIIKNMLNNPEFALYFVRQNDLKNARGEYNGDTQNELFVGINLEDLDEMLGTLFHELAHKVADILFPRNKCAPPSSSGFLADALKDLELLKQSKSPHAPLVLNLFNEVATLYPQPQTHPAEYLARIPQAALLLAFKKKLNLQELELAMKECLPNLYAFWQEKFLPLCDSYLGKE